MESFFHMSDTFRMMQKSATVWWVYTQCLPCMQRTTYVCVCLEYTDNHISDQSVSPLSMNLSNASL